jgi:hypothetical protein
LLIRDLSWEEFAAGLAAFPDFFGFWILVVVLSEGTSVLLPKKNVFSATLLDFTGFRES